MLYTGKIIVNLLAEKLSINEIDPKGSHIAVVIY